MVDVIGEMVVQKFTELVHLFQDALGRPRVLGYCEAHRGEVALVNHSGAVSPCEQVERGGEVLALSVGVLAPGDRVDEIKRGVTADELDRFRPWRGRGEHYPNYT
jgi:hypothetical protein